MFKINIITKNNKRFKKKIVLFIIFILYIISFTIVSGKYVVNSIKNLLTSSQALYFYSDTLTEEDGTVYNLEAAGSNNIQIILYTRDRENNLAKTKDPIEYELSFEADDGIECKFGSSTEDIIKGTIESGGEVTKFLTVSSNLSDGLIGKSVKIIAKTTGTFEKTLSATYIFVKSQAQIDGISLEDNENRGYCSLIINNTGNETKEYEIRFANARLIIDTTNKYDEWFKAGTGIMDENKDGYIDYLTPLSVSANSSINIKLYKKDIDKQYKLELEDGIYEIKEKGGST